MAEFSQAHLRHEHLELCCMANRKGGLRQLQRTQHIVKVGALYGIYARWLPHQVIERGRCLAEDLPRAEFGPLCTHITDDLTYDVPVM